MDRIDELTDQLIHQLDLHPHMRQDNMSANMRGEASVMRLLGAIDDAAFAEQVVRACARKGYGELRIRQELRARGVAESVAAQALRGFAPEADVLYRLLDKRLRGDVSDRRACEKAMAALQRRGFTFAQIREAMREYRARAEEEQ